MTEFNRYEFQILDVCQQLKGYACGSWDGEMLHDLHHRYLWLKHRLATWEPSGERFSHYDRVVKELAVTAATIAEATWPEWKS